MLYAKRQWQGARVMKNAVMEAVKAAGNQQKLAKDLGISQQRVSVYLSQGWMPMGRAKKAEELYGIPRLRLINPIVRAWMLGD